MTRVLLYSHDPHGEGHTPRMLAVAEHLVGQLPGLAVLLVTDAPALDPSPLPQQVDFLRLPSVPGVAGSVSGPWSAAPGDEAILRMRTNLVLMAALDFAPDLVIVDHDPLGLADELAPTLDMLARRLDPPKIALLLRDIPEPSERGSAQWEGAGWHAAVARHYGAVLVMGEAEVFDVAEEYGFPAASADLLHYCGPLQRPSDGEARAAARGRFGLSLRERVVLVAVDRSVAGIGLATAYLRGLQPGAHGWHTLLCLGEALAPEQRQALAQLAGHAPRVICISEEEQRAAALDAADAVLAMADPALACALMAQGRAGVLVPHAERFAQQWIRAERLGRFGLLRALHPRLVTVGTLMESVDAALADARAGQETSALPSGLSRLQHAVSGLLAQRARTTPPYPALRWPPPPRTSEPEGSALGAAVAALGRSLGLQPFTRSRAAARRAGGVA